MLDALIQLGLFTAKFLIVLAVIVTILSVFFGLIAREKQKQKGKLLIKNLNEKYNEYKTDLLSETLPKKELKKYLKSIKAKEKADANLTLPIKKVYVLNFHGDIKASAVSSLSEEITAILNVATPQDEVVLRLESAGGLVHGYGLAAAQLMRIRAKNIPLTIAIDKIAASGGYMMACIANKILAAPFSIIGSIGVIVQLPNFHRVLQDKHIDFEMLTAGEYKRTLTVFGQNTEEGRQKLKEEIEDLHQQFKDLIKKNREQIDIQQVATGEHWAGEHALQLKLVDAICTSDDYLLECSKDAKLYEICYVTKKPFLAKFSSAATLLQERFLPLSI